MGVVLEFSSRKRRVQEAMVAEVYKIQNFPPRYRLRARETAPGAPKGWLLGVTGVDHETAKRFLADWRSRAYAAGLHWQPKDFSRDFPEFAAPHRENDGVLILEPEQFARLQGPEWAC